MLKSILSEKYPFNTKSYKFQNQGKFNVIYLLVLSLFFLILSIFYFSSGVVKTYYLNKLKSFDQFLIKEGFRIQEIEIIGTQYLSKDYFRNIIDNHNSVNIFNIDLPKIYNKIIQNSWIKEAHVERVLPDTIKIKILEKKPIAIWQSKKGNKLVTANGDVISHGNVNTFKNSFPIITGYKAKENISSILQILETNKNLAKNIWSLRFINQRRWDLHFNQGLIVRLPSHNVFKAWQKIIKIQKNYNVLSLRLTEIDLRNPKQVVGKINVDKKMIRKRKSL